MVALDGAGEFACSRGFGRRRTRASIDEAAARNMVQSRRWGARIRLHHHRPLFLDGGLDAGGRAFRQGQCLSHAATRCICSPRPAGLATTPRWKMPSISAGSKPPRSGVGAGRHCSEPASRKRGRSPAAIPRLRGAASPRARDRRLRGARAISRTTPLRGTAARQVTRRSAQSPCAGRVQHSRHHLRRPL